MSSIFLHQCRKAWGTDQFREVLALELTQLPAGQLPLQQALAHSSRVSDEPITILVHGVEDDGPQLQARVGILFTGMVTDCSCAGDPSPDQQVNEQCELLVQIDKITGETLIRLID